jgi:heat shock protein HslJ
MMRRVRFSRADDGALARRSSGERRTPTGWLALAALAAALVLAACGGDGEGAPAGEETGPGGGAGADTGAAASATGLEGPTWVLDNASLAGVAEGVVITAVFRNGSLSGSSGCNRYRTGYELGGSSLTVSGEIVGTKMACPQPEADAEAAFLAVFPTVESYSLDRDELRLRAAGGVELTFRAAATSLVGSWRVTSYYTGDAVVSTLSGHDISITFGDNGTVTGDSGCNAFAGTYTADGSTIRIADLASTTRRSCAADATAQEADLLVALSAAATIGADVKGPVLERADGGIAVTLAAPA